MKSKKSDSSGKSTAISHGHDHVNDIFLEILPVIFHKLKNKLTPVIGYAQILKARGADDFSCERLVKIENSAGELAALLNKLKDYFQVEATVLAPGNVNRVLNGLLPEWEKTAAGEQVRIALDLAPALPEIALHQGQIQVLLRNLAANAFSALRLKPSPLKEIRLTTRCQDGRVQLTIRDNGIGMDQEELDNIWTPFYAKFPAGSGLGLVCCEKIIANHGALCRVASRPGEFSEFAIDFPVPEKPVARKTNSALDDPIDTFKEDA